MPEAFLQNENQSDKRVDPRFSVRIPIVYRVLDDPEEIVSLLERNKMEKQAHTLNISLGGLFIASAEALKNKSILSLTISIPDLAEKLKAMTEVVWTNERGGGIRFLAMKEEDMNLFKTYLSRFTPAK